MLKRFSHRLAKIWYRNKFDTAWYLERYQDVADAKIDPLEHYTKYGRREGRFISHEEEQKAFEKSKDYKKLKGSVLFDSKYYAENYGVKTDPVLHYLTVGYKLGYNPSLEFDTERYLSEYPDIYSAGMNPLVHFELCGRQEGRKALPVIPPVEYSGMVNNGEKLLLFSHELSLTGAPIALLNAAKLLREIGEHVTVFSPKSGPLEEELKEAGIEYFVEPKCIVKLGRRDENLLAFLDSFKLILFNTIDTLRYASYLHPHTPKVMWVHEGAFGYECLQHNVDAREAFEYMDKVYSVGDYSKSYTDKFIPEEKSGILLYGVQDIAGDQIQQAGKNEEKLTFGIFGVCNERKGTHLFIDAISRLPNHIKSACIFKVVGKLEETDFCNKIQAKGLNAGVLFTGELKHDEMLREMASCDVVVCPSLDDPMPIVCTEAMQLHKTVIASDNTGTAAFIEHGKNGFICHVDSQSGESNLQSVLEESYAARARLKEIGDSSYEIYASNFTMNKFKETLVSLQNEEWLKIKDKEEAKKGMSPKTTNPCKKACIIIGHMTSVRLPYYMTYAEDYQKYCDDNTGNSVIAEFGRAPLNYDFVYDNWHENEEADTFIILAANDLRPSAKMPWDKCFHLFEHCDKPIHMIGLGAQATLEEMNPREYVKSLSPEMVRWVHLLADRCHTIGTRGEFTADVIKALGVSNVEPVGCPTWYVNGWNQPKIVKKEWSKQLKPGFFTCWEPYSDWHVAWHRALLDNALQLTDPKFIIQSEFNFIPYMLGYKDPAQLFAHLTPEDFRKSAEAIQKHFGLTPYEVYGNEKLKNMFEVFTDISDWSDFVRTRDFNFGFRIHGSIIALKNGVPAICVVSDSRMYEMCELYHIPYICVNQIASSDFNLEKIYNEADYSEMNKKYEQHLRNYISFLDKNGISHTFTRK